MKSFVSYSQSCLRLLTGPRPVFIVLPLLMILLVVGTIAQKYIGIYEAQHRYFSSFIAWIGPIPFPGGIILMGLFAVNLLGKFLFKTEWSWKRAGINISHFGVIILVVGGVLTALTAREGYLVLAEGEVKAIIEDYHDRELVIRSTALGDILHIPQSQLRSGLKIHHDKVPFTLNIDLYCANCGVTRRDESAQDGWTVPGKFMQLQDKPLDLQDEKNMTGIEFTVTQVGQADEKYLTFDKFPKPPQIKVADDIFTVTIERQQRPLPFRVKLVKFEEDLHPGTDMARAFTSDVMIEDNGVSWPARIAMNEPLRYKGYTFYQTSFDMTGTPTTVLSVVENKGRIFPYLASALIALGLMWHVAVRLKLFARRPRSGAFSDTGATDAP